MPGIRVSVRKLVFLLGTFGLSLVVAVLVDYDSVRTEIVVQTLVTLFSILAGMMGVVTAISFRNDVNWRKLERDRARLVFRLNQWQLLFWLYLVTMALIMASALIGKRWPRVAYWVDVGYVFVGTWAFLLSFALPSMPRRAMLGDYDRRIEEKRAEVGLGD